jgi:hypothetical protein
MGGSAWIECVIRNLGLPGFSLLVLFWTGKQLLRSRLAPWQRLTVFFCLLLAAAAANWLVQKPQLTVSSGSYTCGSGEDTKLKNCSITAENDSYILRFDGPDASDGLIDSYQGRLEPDGHAIKVTIINLFNASPQTGLQPESRISEMRLSAADEKHLLGTWDLGGGVIRPFDARQEANK